MYINAYIWNLEKWYAAAAAKSLQSCPTLCDPIDGSPAGSTVPGILQARTLEWVAISFSNAWKWKGKWSRSVLSDSSRPHGLQPTRLLHPGDFPGKSTGVGCHCLLWKNGIDNIFAGQEQRRRCVEQTCGHSRGRGGRDKLGEEHCWISTITRETASLWGSAL